MDRDSAIRKIKACLALGRSANANEAAAAMRQAQKLMAEHGLDEQGVAIADVGEAAATVRCTGLPAWEVSLARQVAEAFGCEMLVSHGPLLGWGRSRKKTFQFIGVGSAPEVAAYAQDVLSRQCARARQAHIAQQPKSCKPITKTARGDAFAKAWVWSAVEVLDRFAGNEHNKPLLQAYIARTYPNVTSFKPKSREVGRNVKDSSWEAGARAGRDADLKRGVGSIQEQARLS